MRKLTVLRKRKGFTLIELLIVIVIIASLSIVVFIALNPAKRLMDTRNAKRLIDTESIQKAIEEYLVDNGSLPPQLPSNGSVYQLGTGGSSCAPSCIDLSTALAQYLKTIPTDPLVGSPSATGYTVSASANNAISVNALYMETSTQTQLTYPTGIKNVFIIVMENKDWSVIKGSSSAPYINSLLTRSDASYASNYHSVTPTETYTGYLHGSEANYIWLEAGTNCFSDMTTSGYGCFSSQPKGFGSDNDASATNSTSSTSHLATLLTTAGISWKSYQENKPAGCPISSSYPYAAKHEPFVFFQDISGNPPSTATTGACNNVVSYTQLATDLTNNTLPSYAFITPNLCDDMHDSCAPTNNSILQGDQWLQNNLPAILNSSAYKNGGAVFITWDEDSGSTTNNPIGMIVLSPFAKGNGYTNNILYSHSSYVRTTETIFGVRPYLANAASATDLSDLFTTTPGVMPTPTPTPTPTLTPTPPPGSIALRAATSANNGSGGSSLTISKPTGTASGDVLIAHIAVQTAGNTITPPSGWNLIVRKDTSSLLSTAAYWKLASPSEPASYQWSFGTAGEASGGIAGYTGVNNTSPVDASNAQYNNSTNNAYNSGVTTTQANDMLVYEVGIITVTTVNVPTGFAQEWSTTSSTKTTSEMSQEIFSSAGATGQITTTDNDSNNSNITILIALKQ